MKGPGGRSCTSDAPCAGGGVVLLWAGSRLRAQEGQWPCSGRRLSWQPGTSSRDCYLHGSYREYSGGGGLAAKSCLTLCDPMDCRQPSSSVLGISISFSRGSSWPRDQTWVSCISKWILYHWGTRDALQGRRACQLGSNTWNLEWEEKRHLGKTTPESTSSEPFFL